MRWDFILWSFILSLALGLPSQEPARKTRSSCIRMTPEKERQIDTIVEKLSVFLDNLTLEHEHFDIHLIQLGIEQHSQDEEEGKETMLQLTVNDCQLTDDELEEIDHHREKAKHHALEAGKAKAQSADDSKIDPAKKKFDLLYLNLGENGQELLDALDEKKPGPKLMYVQKDAGQLDYLFYKKK